MGIAEHHSLSRQTIEVWCLDLSVLRIECPHVSVTEIIGQDVNNVGTRRLSDGNRPQWDLVREYAHDEDFEIGVHGEDRTDWRKKPQRTFASKVYVKN